MILKFFCLDFLLNAPGASADVLKKSLEGCAENPQIQEIARENFSISLRTQDPTLVFDICSQYGKISAVKVNEEGE
ncbi:MAG: hypothetical protein PHT31_03255 [Candidatus Omnitrophica bacterium]|nr:hypothetical protein [Candidatus Omnitrophota bacterium]MDD5653164.1 hypothetical protein [Candidatus Omnitrophota bacterium]